MGIHGDGDSWGFMGTLEVCLGAPGSGLGFTLLGLVRMEGAGHKSAVGGTSSSYLYHHHYHDYY